MIDAWLALFKVDPEAFGMAHAGDRGSAAAEQPARRRRIPVDKIGQRLQERWG